MIVSPLPFCAGFGVPHEGPSGAEGPSVFTHTTWMQSCTLSGIVRLNWTVVGDNGVVFTLVNGPAGVAAVWTLMPVTDGSVGFNQLMFSVTACAAATNT